MMLPEAAAVKCIMSRVLFITERNVHSSLTQSKIPHFRSKRTKLFWSERTNETKNKPKQKSKEKRCVQHGAAHKVDFALHLVCRGWCDWRMFFSFLICLKNRCCWRVFIFIQRAPSCSCNRHQRLVVGRRHRRAHNITDLIEQLKKNLRQQLSYLVQE